MQSVRDVGMMVRFLFPPNGLVHAQVDLDIAFVAVIVVIVGIIDHGGFFIKT